MIIVSSKTVTLTYDSDDSILTACFNYKPESVYRYFHVTEKDGNFIKTNGLSLGAYMNMVIKPKYKAYEEIFVEN